uniref:M23 family metallopeptidase n=1 Tax=candidate division WOR-3 bacterium TaxID=2052148 RepID=A0A7C4XEY3_UNCW3
MKGNFTIILIARNNIIKNISLSSNTLLSIIIFFILITVSSFALFIYNTQISLTEMKQDIAEEQYREYSKRLEQLKNYIGILKNQMDEQIFIDNKQRNFLQVATIQPDVWAMGIGGIKRYDKPINLSLYNSKDFEQLYESIEILRGQVKLREMSIRELENKLVRNFDLWSRIPTINPVPGAEVSSGFGYRVDPFTGEVRMHEGLDMSAPTGTPVYATGDGVVTFADWNMGYGYVVEIDHGYGFVTRYAHLSKILVKEGELVKRGQMIGRVGATGRAICPHLHYEVIVAGIKVNPINYIDFTNVIFD